MTQFASFPELLDDLATKRPEATAIIDDRRTLNYRELHDETESVARSLISLGVHANDHVACLARNSAEWVVAFLATAKVGAAFVPLNTWYKAAELEWTLVRTGARVLIAEQEFLGHNFADDIESIEPAIRSSQPGMLQGLNLPQLRSLVYFGEPRDGSFGWNEFVHLGEDVPPEEVAKRRSGARADDPLFVLYTSGSTAEPKGVVLPHAAVVSNGYGIGDRRGIASDDRIWLGSPLFYALGAANALPVALTRGATLIVQDRFDPEDATALIERTRATVFYGMSNMIRKLRDAPEFRPERFSSLIKGNAGIEREERRVLIVDIGVDGATQSYGSTEVCGNCFGGFPDDLLEVKLKTCGKLLPNFEAIIVDPNTGKSLNPGEIGLLKVRGNTALGYLGDPEGTAEAFDEFGYFNTGDLGSFSAEGYFYFHSRVKEMIKVGGINISPTEIENLLVSHPGIAEAHVIGVPDSVNGEVAVAFVVAKENLSESDVRSYVRSIAASFKAPTHVVFVEADEVPRTTSGKAAKQILKEKAVNMLNSPVEPSP